MDALLQHAAQPRFLLDKQHLALLSCAGYGCGQPCRAAADNDNVVIRHCAAPYFVLPKAMLAPSADFSLLLLSTPRNSAIILVTRGEQNRSDTGPCRAAPAFDAVQRGHVYGACAGVQYCPGLSPSQRHTIAVVGFCAIIAARSPSLSFAGPVCLFTGSKSDFLHIFLADSSFTAISAVSSATAGAVVEARDCIRAQWMRFSTVFCPARL